MNPVATLDDLISLIRKHQGISPKKEITENTLVEDDLGITGDDGCELLEAIEKKFDISFAGPNSSLRDAFGLSEGQFLFHSEGMCLFWLIASLVGRDPENVKAITVGDLFRAMSKASQRGHVA